MREVGKSKHVGSRDQALAIAYSIKRRGRYLGGRLNRAEGGLAEYDPIMQPPADIGDPVREAMFPNTRSLMRGDENPIRDLPTTPGKVPSPDYDPRYAGAAGETLPFALSGVAGVAGRGAGMAARGVAAAAPAFEETPLMARGLQALPRMLADKAPPSVAGVMATMGGASPGEAQEQGMPAGIVVDPTPGETKEIARINALIAGKRAQLERVMRQSSYRDPAKDPAVIAIQSGLGSLAGEMATVQGPDSPLGQRRAAALKLQQSILEKQHETEAGREAEKHQSEKPFRQEFPNLYRGLPLGGWGLSAVGGALGSKAGAPIKSALSGAGWGTLASTVAAAWPTAYDAATLPLGSKYQKEAADQFWSAPYWQERVAPEVLGGMGIGALGGKYGTYPKAMIGGVGARAEAAAKLRALTKTPEPLPAAAPVAEAAPSPVIPRPKAPPATHHLADGTVLKQYDLGKRGQQWRENGKVISAERARTLRAQQPSGRMPSNALHAPPTESQGGAIRSPMDIAYAVRRQNRAEGGEVHAGPIMSSVPGRTDNHPMDVEEGAYILPADHISSLGEGNTMAGMEVVNHMIESLGVDPQHRGQGKSVPINAAGGEVAIPPEVVMTIGGGDIARGHKMLDDWVLLNRKKHISTLKGLPGPAKS